MGRLRTFHRWGVSIALACIAQGCVRGAQPSQSSVEGTGSLQESSGTASSGPLEDSTGATSTSALTSSAGQSTEAEPSCESLLEAIQQDPELSRFKDAIARAELQWEFEQTAQRTVFAPNNAAFDRLAPETAQAMQDDPEFLRMVLKHHIITGRVSNATDYDRARVTLAGYPVAFSSLPNGEFGMGGAKLLASKPACKNGLVHVTQDLMWIPKRNFVEMLASEPGFERLAEIVKASSFHKELERPTIYTFFVPNNQAIENLEAGMGKVEFAAMLRDEARLRAFLFPHLHAGLRVRRMLRWRQEFPSLDAKKPLRIELHQNKEDPSEVPERRLNGIPVEVGLEAVVKNGVMIEIAETLHNAY